ncbi:MULTISPECIES: phosphotransferase [unclassified Paenibacillus]|uniref:phosphotransferase n=1 Tax=unclassified Paenibacillus TaxID=185978 RepID=UPI0024B8EA5C|nr:MULTISPECIES: phosphotransferase [unclassified Paenibacillus]
MINMFSEIPDAYTWNTVEEVLKGWSKDKKYDIKTKDNRELLLRVSDVSQYEKKKWEYESVKKLDYLKGILMSRPLDFGICNHGESVYSLFTWIEGEDAEKIIPALNANDQYQFGVQAGEIHSLGHSIWSGRG